MANLRTKRNQWLIALTRVYPAVALSQRQFITITLPAREHRIHWRTSAGTALAVLTGNAVDGLSTPNLVAKRSFVVVNTAIYMNLHIYYTSNGMRARQTLAVTS
jgi:hypothetical protein